MVVLARRGSEASVLGGAAYVQDHRLATAVVHAVLHATNRILSAP